MPQPQRKPRRKSPQPRSKKAKAAARKAPKKAAAAQAFELKVLSAAGKTLESIPADAIISSSETHPHLLYQSAVMAQANQRVGTVKTKTRGEVSGGGKKPWRQKGTGRARHGSIRSPIWRKGGTTHGPKVRDFSYQLPKRMKLLALIAGLKDKVLEGKVYLIDEFASKDGKTKAMAGLVTKLELAKPVIITDAYDKKTLQSVRNIHNVVLTTSDQVAPYDVLASNECLITRKGYENLLKRLKTAA